MLFQQLTAQISEQQISGKVLDETTQEPLAFATVVILNTDPVQGTITDAEGNFSITNVSPGRYSLQASYVGYEPLIIPEVLVTGGKATTLSFLLREMPAQLDGIVVKPRIQKAKALKPLATVSARMLSVEEGNRYAGGFDDPARLASAFAGVASGISSNAIVIRGNAPKFLQWKLEGVEIPNPNHFADLGTFGGGGLTALSSHLLANSDFFTGAFPAEYNNALSGVFDIKMRPGNASKSEHSVQLGLIGIDLASEGPFNKKNNASYLFNYRYSTLGLVAPLLPEDARGTNYQDLSFKIHVPTQKAGIFSLWGTGLIDNSGQQPQMNTEEWEYLQDTEEQKVKQYMGASGITHRYLLGASAYIRSTLAFSSNGINLKTNTLNNELQLTDKERINNVYTNLTFKSHLNKKFSGGHANRTGINIRRMGYELLLETSEDGSGDLQTIADTKGNSALFSAFTNSTLNFKKLTLNLGVNAQLFSLNSNYTIEPRVGLSYQVNEKNTLSFGYGLHSRLEPINIYFIRSGETLPNTELDFTKAHHFVLGYDLNINKNTSLKAETYYQSLFDIPVIEGSTYALINLKNDWFVNDAYVNQGVGRNYGIDLTLERYLNKGFYYLLTASLFQSVYKTHSQGQWFNTRFNKGYLFNLLAGREFRLGKSQQNLLGINVRLSLQGGDRYSGIDTDASIVAQDVVYDESNPFNQQAKTAFTTHITFNYQWSRPKTTQEISLKILNANNYKEFLGHRFNLRTQAVEAHREALMIPNLSYKISF